MGGRVNPTDPAWVYHGWEHLQRYMFGARFAATATRVLDLASGTGYGSIFLRQAGAGAVVGVDHDPATIAAARARPAPAGVQFVVGDALAFEPALGKFDLVTSFETIEHLSDPPRFIARLHEYLLPGGRLVISAPNTLQFQRATRRIDNEHHLNEPTYEQLRAWLEPHFDIEQEWEQSPVERGLHQLQAEFGALHSLLLVRAEMWLRRLIGRSIVFRADHSRLRAHTEIMPLLPERRAACQQFIFVCRRRDQ